MYNYKRKTSFSERLPFLGKLLTKLILTAVFSYFLAYLFKTFIFFPHRFSDASMLPSFKQDELIFLSPIVRITSLNYDKVVFSQISGTDLVFAGRIIGKPGDKISIQSKKVLRNGQVIGSKTAKNNDTRIFDSSFSNRDNLNEITMNKDEYFILCDNRDECMDSREYGSILLKNIIAIKLYK
jgi:signal peptidase I